MVTLTGLLASLMTSLQTSPLCVRAAVLDTREFSPEQFFCKLRADLQSGKTLQVRVYYNRGHVDYAYQVFTDVPLLRWDNKEEFPKLATYPHHHHDDQGHVRESPLTGVPERDLKIVLGELQRLFG